jgi:ADP-heptose:LPS heptosyltransferase
MKIFVLRNNDLGDVLLVTPLIHALKKAFPACTISLGVGDWAKSLLENNPDLDEVFPCNAPWHNKQNCRFRANSLKTFWEGLTYVLFSKEAQLLTKQKFTHGIDVLGSRQGSWLLRRAGIPLRFGVNGYAGGDKWCHKSITFEENKNVAKAALDFLPLFGAKEAIQPRPLIYLSSKEKDEARQRWISGGNKKKVVVAPGAGFPEKCWGNENFSQLLQKLINNHSICIKIVGSLEDRNRIQLEKNDKVEDFCGSLSLRQTASLVSTCDFVITNTSLCMHLAGAFRIPSMTLLGEWYDSAQLHFNQWGYSEGVVLGKELNDGKTEIMTVCDAYQRLKIFL